MYQQLRLYGHETLFYIVSSMKLGIEPSNVAIILKRRCLFRSNVCLILLPLMCLQILQQAQNLISSIRQPQKSDHERRVRDFSRYMESEMLRIPEASWDECSSTIMTVTSQHLGAGHVVNISQPSVYQQVLYFRLLKSAVQCRDRSCAHNVVAPESLQI